MKDRILVKIALVGAGFAADIHAEAYSKIVGADIDVVAVAVAQNKKRAERFCQQHGYTARVFTDADKMIEETDADVIDLTVPTFLHIPLAIKAAAVGKHVICEKPLTGYFGNPCTPIAERQDVGFTSKRIMLKECLKDCRRIRKAFEKSGSIFCYAENWVYARPVWKAKRLVKAAGGKILEIRCGESHSGSHSNFAAEWKYTGGGSLIRMGAHPYGAVIHLKLWEGIMRDGKPIYPYSVIATTARYRDFLKNLPETQDRIISRPVDVEDWSTGIITFTDGTNATVIASDTTLGGIENWINIYASNCRIEGRISNNNSVMVYAPTSQELKNEYTIEKTETKAGWSVAQPDENWMGGYHSEMQDFIEAILEKRQPESNLDLAILCAQTIYAAYLSAETGQRIEIPQESL